MGVSRIWQFTWVHWIFFISYMITDLSFPSSCVAGIHFVLFASEFNYQCGWPCFLFPFALWMNFFNKRCYIISNANDFSSNHGIQQNYTSAVKFVRCWAMMYLMGSQSSRRNCAANNPIILLMRFYLLWHFVDTIKVFSARHDTLTQNN